jgi:hypothetical protein
LLCVALCCCDTTTSGSDTPAAGPPPDGGDGTDVPDGDAGSDGDDGDGDDSATDDSGEDTLPTMPTFDPAPGEYPQEIAVVIHSDSDPSSVHFTTDGTSPDESAPTYEEPIALSGDGTTTEIRAVAYDDAGTPSEVAQGTYLLRYRYALATATEGAGSVELDPAEPVPAGADVELTAVPDEGWRFEQWSGDASGAENPTVVAVGAESSVTATFSPKESEARLRGGIVVNEILPDPSGSSCSWDTDGNGTAAATDEFVELYNAGENGVSLAGLELWDSGGDCWFTFPADTTLPAGSIAVVIASLQDGGTLPEPEAEGEAFAAESGSVLNNSGDTVVLYDPDADRYTQLAYNGADEVDPTAPDTGFTGFSPTAERSGPIEVWGRDSDGSSQARIPDGSCAACVEPSIEATGVPASPGATNGSAASQ